MEPGTSSFDHWLSLVRDDTRHLDLRAALDIVASRSQRRFGAHLWFAEVLGRRWSFMAGWMEESPSVHPTERIRLNEDIGIVSSLWGTLGDAEREALVGFLAELVRHKQEKGEPFLSSDEEILPWLREDRQEALEGLWQWADRVRREHVGNAVHLRGLIEISNFCVRRCAYCGLCVTNRQIERYRMSPEEVLECVRFAVARSHGTVVLQSGEDPHHTAEWVADLVRRIKEDTNLAVTLSLGERTPQDLQLWKEAGADRYLLRFETSNRALLERVQPPSKGKTPDRLALLSVLRDLGYEVGSGTMVGLWGQSYSDLARDLAMFREMDLDMIGLGPYIPHPQTPMAQYPSAWQLPADEQVPNTALMTYKVLALARILCPRANIPATTALTTLDSDQGLELGFSRGANVFMPNITPQTYREKYAIYPGKTSLVHRDEESLLQFHQKIRALGREVATGRGDSENYRQRRRAVGQQGHDERPRHLPV